jgi:hypothetical protein
MTPINVPQSKNKKDSANQIYSALLSLPSFVFRNFLIRWE